MNLNMEELNNVIDDILKKLPYSRRNDQKQILARYIAASIEGNTGYITEKTGISHPTIKEIQTIFQDELSGEEKAMLVDHLQPIIRRQYQEEE